MSKYFFETEQFGISDKGIHLLRSRFNYQTIEFKEIDELVVERGRQVNNWLVLLVIGVALFLGAVIYLLALLYDIFWGNTLRVIYIEYIVVPVIPILLGVFMIYNSLKIGLNIRVFIGDKSKTLSIEELRKRGEITNFMKFLKENNLTKSRIVIKDDSVIN